MLSIEHYIKISIKRCTTVIEWLTHSNGDFQCKENFKESAVQQLLKADRSPSISKEHHFVTNREVFSKSRITHRQYRRYIPKVDSSW